VLKKYPKIQAVTDLTSGNPLFDGFGRMRVSNQATFFDAQCQYNKLLLLWDETLTSGGTATHLPNESSIALTVGTTSGDAAVRQTHSYLRYLPGKSQQILITGVLGSSKTNVRQRIGYFDNDNGVFFEQTGAGLSVVRRTKTSGSVVNNTTFQTEWNLDRLDGSGPSGIVLDPSKAQIFIIDLQWLGVGRVRFGFDFGSQKVFCHEAIAANSLSTVYMSTASLPVRYSIDNLGVSASSTTLIAICTSVASEGGSVQDGFPGSANSGITSIGVTTRRAILSIRPKATFNSLENRGEIFLQEFSIIAKSNDALWEIIRNGTLGGSPSWQSAGDNSIAEYDVAGTTVTGGDVVKSGYVVSGVGSSLNLLRESVSENKLPLCMNADGTVTDCYSIVLTSMNSTSTCAGAMTWKELY
jgi:hypothetical protein